MRAGGQEDGGDVASQRPPSPWVVRFLGLMPPGAQVLDIACGAGRHFAPVLAQGGTVVGIDRDISVARDRWSGNSAVSLVAADLECGAPPPFRGQVRDGVIVTNYLWRPLLADIVGAVDEAGVLIYETFALGQERLGRPRNPEFLLRPGELLDAVAGRLHVVAYEHVRLSAPDRIVQRIAAVGLRHPAVQDGGPAF
ncbi:MAG: class I SAM-dependent methyltransferase [Hyphomicrobiaceae bacterium]